MIRDLKKGNIHLPWDQDKYVYTYRFAAEWHKGKYVPGTDNLPYIMHVSFVSIEVISALQVEPGHDSDFAIQCALLHDVLEDTNVTLDEIKSRFGEKIASGVFALSKNPDLSNSLQMADCLKKIQQQPHEVWMVKLADRITNLQPPPRDWSNVKRIHYQREAMEIYKTLGSASKFLASRLSEKIKTYEQYFISPEGIQHNSII